MEDIHRVTTLSLIAETIGIPLLRRLLPTLRKKNPSSQRSPSGQASAAVKYNSNTKWGVESNTWEQLPLKHGVCSLWYLLHVGVMCLSYPFPCGYYRLFIHAFHSFVLLEDMVNISANTTKLRKLKRLLLHVIFFIPLKREGSVVFNFSPEVERVIRSSYSPPICWLLEDDGLRSLMVKKKTKKTIWHYSVD